MGGFIFGAVAGVIVGYFVWGGLPEHLQSIVESSEISFGTPSFALYKIGSGQVAIVHGLVDDLEACEMFGERLELDGGSYLCLPVP